MAVLILNKRTIAIIRFICIFSCLHSQASVLGSNAIDPCTDASTLHLGSIRQRLVGYKLADGEDAICDMYLNEGWYFTNNFVLASTSERCGTVKNWYRKNNDSLPDKLKDEIDIELCRNGIKDKCDQTMHVSVIKCDNDTYAFHLGPVSSCIEAFCLESISHQPVPTGRPLDISTTIPTINVEVKRVRGENELQFYCDFSPKANTNYYYEVSWAISHNSLWNNELHHSEPVRHLSDADFRKKTMLTERHLTSPTYFGLGQTIRCSITASEDIASAKSTPVFSPEKFCGIRALNSSSHIHLVNKQGADIYYELTIPFGCEQDSQTHNECYLDATLFIPSTDTNCNLPDIVQRKSEKNSCGLRFHIDEVGIAKILHIQPKFPLLVMQMSKEMKLILTTKYDTHPFFNDYSVDTVQVTVTTNQIIIGDKKCYAVCDPHMLTFDGRPYENQNEGIFYMYINKEYNQKVQIQTTSCGHNGGPPFCVCGVAVQAGSDVFVFSTCVDRRLDVRFVQCNDRILRERVNKLNDYNYQITLPSGTHVDIILVGDVMNVYVYPSVSDFMQTSGLCGSFDGDTLNDLEIRTGSTEKDHNMSWMVDSNESLFNANVILRPWEDHYFFCQCFNTENKLLDTATCEAETKKTCSYKPQFVDRCFPPTHRRRRFVNGKFRLTEEGDFHKSVKVAFMPKYRKPVHTMKQRSISTYTDDNARPKCLHMLNTTVFQRCSSVPGLNFTSVVDACVLDAKITGTMDWTMSHLETIKALCIQHVDIQKMPPKEDLVGITITINGTSFSNISDENTSLPLSSVISDEVFEEIRSVSCTRECSGYGNCDNGTCICEKGHSGEDCSKDSSRPPEMQGIPDEGLCDLQERACMKTSVFSNNLAFDSQVKCKIEALEINLENEVLIKEDYQVTGVPQTYMEVSCQLAQRKRQSVDDGIDNILARVYNISLSNDGVKFSEEDTLIVYDSDCVSCYKTEGTLGCQKQNGYCVSNGECHGLGDKLGCYVCAASVDGSAAWQPDCSTTRDSLPVLYVTDYSTTRDGLPYPNRKSDAQRSTTHHTFLIVFVTVAVGLF